MELQCRMNMETGIFSILLKPGVMLDFQKLPITENMPGLAPCRVEIREELRCMDYYVAGCRSLHDVLKTPMEKNQFLIFNHVLSELYRCRTYQDLGDAFLPMLRMLIPYRYASIMRRAEAGPSIHLVDPLCVPAAFAEAERRYMRFAADDYTAWLSCCREATLFRESDLVGEQQRLRSTIYQECYQPFEVYDSLQYGIVCNGQPLGALSLFRCREDGPFSDHELFLLRSVGTHLNQQMAALLAGTPPAGGSPDHSLAAVAARHGLTLRERQLLEELTRFRNNQEIAEALSVRASTLQKHFQNMFRKFGVTSRWELMRLLLEEGALPWVPPVPQSE